MEDILKNRIFSIAIGNYFYFTWKFDMCGKILLTYDSSSDLSFFHKQNSCYINLLMIYFQSYKNKFKRYF